MTSLSSPILQEAHSIRESNGSTGSLQCCALYDYAAASEEELSMKSGDILDIESEQDGKVVYHQKLIQIQVGTLCITKRESMGESHPIM